MCFGVVCFCSWAMRVVLWPLCTLCSIARRFSRHSTPSHRLQRSWPPPNRSPPKSVVCCLQKVNPRSLSLAQSTQVTTTPCLHRSDKAIKAKHDSHVVQGQTASSGNADEDTEHHFVVFIPFNGKLYELDGSCRSAPRSLTVRLRLSDVLCVHMCVAGLQSSPILRGTLTDANSFLSDAAKAIGTHYIHNAQFGGSASFSMLAITGNADAL
jgi:hypothetical protein